MITLGTGAGNFDIDFQIGSYREITFAFDVDISTWTFEFSLRRFKGDREKQITLTLGSGLTFPIYQDEVLAAFSATNTSIEEGEYYWQLRRLDQNIPLLNGRAFFTYDAPSGDQEPLTITSMDQTVEVTVTNNSVTTGGGTGGGHVIKQDGTSFAQETNLDFQGSLIVTDDSSTSSTQINAVGSDLFLYNNFY